MKKSGLISAHWTNQIVFSPARQTKAHWFIITSVMLLLTIAAAISRADAPASSQPSTTDAANAELRQEVDALKAKVERLEAKDAALHQNSSSQPSVLFGQASPQLLANEGLATGYDPLIGFVIRSDDGAFSFHPGAVIDFRYMTSYREKLSPGNGSEVPGPRDNTQSGFDVTRARLTLDGNFTKRINYFIQFQADQGSAASLLDAYGVYHFSDSPFGMKFGQFKDPIWHERNLSEASLLAVDRSLTEFLLGGGQTSRVQGVGVVYDKDRLRAQAIFHDGFNSLNTKFFDSGGIGAGVGGGAGITSTDFGLSSRTEWLLFGDRSSDFNPFGQYDHGFTSLGNKEEFAVVGAGADFSQAGANNVLFHTVDLQYNNPNGFSAYGAYLGSYREIRQNEGVTPGYYYDPGFLVQAAYLVTPKIEPFARYDYTYLSRGSTGLSTGEFQEITLGANYYIYRQNLKFTLDASWLPNGAPSDSDALGILKDVGHNEVVARAQVQLAL